LSAVKSAGWRPSRCLRDVRGEIAEAGERFARLALRLQQIEFLLELGGFACRSRCELLRSAVRRCSLTASSGALGADQSTRPLGQAKEPRTRPMRPGDLLGDGGQRGKVLAVIFEPVLTNEDGVGLSVPLAQ
jgi:hypothetical protein